jgi:hypothetical protein
MAASSFALTLRETPEDHIRVEVVAEGVPRSRALAATVACLREHGRDVLREDLVLDAIGAGVHALQELVRARRAPRRRRSARPDPEAGSEEEEVLDDGADTSSSRQGVSP